MKKRTCVLLSMIGIFVLISCTGLILLKISVLDKEVSSYSNPYYEVLQPEAWNFVTIRETNTIVNRGEEQIGTITVYPESEFGYSSSAIVSNIYGMHAYLKEELTSFKKIPDLEYCIVVGYEASVARQLNNELLISDELHYIFISEDSTIVDFEVAYSMADEEVIKVMESLRVKSHEKKDY